MKDLPAELQIFGSLLDAQPQPVREAFQYCLCLMMVETGKMEMELEKTTPGDEQVLYHFKTTDGEAFAIPHPGITSEQESEVMELLREILEDEDIL